MPFSATLSSPIVTTRLLLEPVRSEFAPALLSGIADWEVMRWLAAPPWPYGLADMLEWIAKASLARSQGRDLDFAITLAGRPIGCIGVTGIGFDPVLGYWLAKPYWGRGYMSEAARAVIERLFGEGQSFLSSGVLAGNAASLRVQDKLGFRVVNERYIPARPHGRLMPHVDTVLGRARWSKLCRAA